MNSEKKVSDIADYASLRKLANALWHKDTAYHGAAVLIGAGFSRCAARTADPNRRLPLWTDLSRTLAAELKTNSNTEPLRLAEEYSAFFGRQALHAVAVREIDDAAWSPGDLHQSLLTLPWSEVLTTNWDTLLERASESVHSPIYSLVSRQEALSSARSPRIVKLHGTIETAEDLVFTQEDYRRYPQRRAAFVNLARQVFIENELCLVGFSGEDPNFLQWAGWVRDQLATHARMIYLVGALRLTTAKRRYLESINVAPIDLDELVAEHDDHEVRHRRAIEIFLAELEHLKPKPAWEWAPTTLSPAVATADELNKPWKDPAYGASLLEKQLRLLASDRESYPGWLICPPHLRFKLQGQVSNPWPNKKHFQLLSPDSRARLLYEMAWRHSITYQPVAAWLVEEMTQVIDGPDSAGLTKKQQMHIALLLLKNSRWVESVAFDAQASKVIDLLQSGVKYWSESASQLAYHQALVARDAFDYPAMEALLGKIETASPVWKLRKAALLAELGRADEFERLIVEAYRELLGQHRNNRNSIYVLSRLGWAHWLKRGIEMLKPEVPFQAFPSFYHDALCSPWDQIEHVTDQISKVNEQIASSKGVVPSFEPGTYTDNAGKMVFNNETHPVLQLDGISADAGFPIRASHVNFLGEPASKLALLDQEQNPRRRFALAIRAADTESAPSIHGIFSRVQVACMHQDQADWLLDHCLSTTYYWTNKWASGSLQLKQHALDRLRVFVEVLARIVVRASVARAKQVLHAALELGKQTPFQHIWLFDAMRHLMEYALQAVPQEDHAGLLLDVLSFPLALELPAVAQNRPHRQWPNPVIEHPGSRGPNEKLDRRIQEIIDRVAPNSEDSLAPLLRLLPLIKGSFLTTAELDRLTLRIWGSPPDYKACPETGLLKYLYFTLPAPDPAAVVALVRKTLFEAQGEHLLDAAMLADIASAAGAVKPPQFPEPSQAVDYFGRLVAWRPQSKDKDFFGWANMTQKQLGEMMGGALSRSIVPTLPKESLTEANFAKLLAFWSDVESPEVITSFVFFAVADESFVERTERLIRKALQDRAHNKVANASHALLKWRELSQGAPVLALVSRMVYLIESGRSIGLTALLWTTREMLDRNWLTDEHIKVLTGILPSLYEDASYDHVEPSSHDAVSVSLVRAACVKLAHRLLDGSEAKDAALLRTVECARTDPLPEVRFAETSLA